MSKTNVAPNTFEESTANVAKYRLQLQSCPSEIIQARISFDAESKLELSTLTPLQQQRVSTLKKETREHGHGVVLICVILGGRNDKRCGKRLPGRVQWPWAWYCGVFEWRGVDLP